jgi:hypothetical protein
MAEINLTQGEADALRKLEKVCIENKQYYMPDDFTPNVSVNLSCIDKKEFFSLDLSRGRINLKKQKYQNRAREAVVLVRLDLGSPHRNPDGTEVGVPHIHLYKEGFADKWAYTIPDGVFKNLDDPMQILADFMTYCNVVNQPVFTRRLFS